MRHQLVALENVPVPLKSYPACCPQSEKVARTWYSSSVQLYLKCIMCASPWVALSSGGGALLTSRYWSFIPCVRISMPYSTFRTVCNDTYLSPQLIAWHLQNGINYNYTALKDEVRELQKRLSRWGFCACMHVDNIAWHHNLIMEIMERMNIVCVYHSSPIKQRCIIIMSWIVNIIVALKLDVGNDSEKVLLIIIMIILKLIYIIVGSRSCKSAWRQR